MAKHKSVERITMVEIDGTVVDMCKEFAARGGQAQERRADHHGRDRRHRG
ncbi:hypothetical protein [Pseudomonas aeruginosa]